MAAEKDQTSTALPNQPSAATDLVSLNPNNVSSSDVEMTSANDLPTAPTASPPQQQQQLPTTSPQQQQDPSTTSTPQTAPFANHPADLLPSSLPAAFPKGLPTNTSTSTDPNHHTSNTPSTSHTAPTPFTSPPQNILDRKETLLRTHTPEELLKRYKTVSQEIEEKLGENERKREEVGAEIENLEQAREIERKIWEKMKMRGVGGGEEGAGGMRKEWDGLGGGNDDGGGGA